MKLEMVVSDQILTQKDGAIATIVLNRPEKFNAFTVESWRALADAFDMISKDDDVRCVILRGSGQKAFAAGADIEEFKTHRSNHAQARVYGSLIEGAIIAVRDCRHPTIAAIQGACIGGGLEIAAVCDLRISADGSRFGSPVSNLGLTMSHAELRGVTDLIGPGRMLELLLEAKLIDSAEAATWGLINRTVPAADFEAEVASTAKRIALGAPLVARWHKRFVRRLRDPRPFAPEETDEAFRCFDTRDFIEGRQAFAEKRKPIFTGE
jgi:enoyl-CoA hydratase